MKITDREIELLIEKYYVPDKGIFVHPDKGIFKAELELLVAIAEKQGMEEIVKIHEMSINEK